MGDVGKKAPAFTLESTGEDKVSLASLKGETIVLYFYPRDNTPGCTTEACDFRDNIRRLRSAGVRVLGVSKDSIASHDKFRTKYKLPFDLLSDPDNKVAKAYGAYGEKNMYGKKVLGTIRSTFIIGEDGKVRAKWSPVRVKGHVDAVLEALRENRLNASSSRRGSATPKTSRSTKGAAKSVKKKMTRKTSAKKKATTRKGART